MYRSHTFTCMNQSLEQVSDFKYSGLRFHESRHNDHIIAPVLDKATTAWAVPSSARRQNHKLAWEDAWNHGRINL